jgi:LuxR family transcriptional regulator, maltose regulon positive regulatory protein
VNGCDGELLPAHEHALDSEPVLAERPRVSHVPRPTPLLVRRPRLLARLDAATPLTILRAPVGFGKTTLVAQWVGTRRGSDELVAWLRVRESTDVASFWALAFQVAVDAGLPAEAGAVATGTPSHPQARLERALATSPVPVVLVVDGLENVDSAALERDLLDLLRHAPRLRLVVCLRALGQLPAHRHLDLDTTLVDASDLQLTEEEIEALLALAGVDATPASVRRIAEETGGWAESVRAVVLRLRDAPATEAELVDVVRAIAAEHVHERLLVDGGGPDSVEFALVTSLPEEFTAELAEVLTDHPATRRLLHGLDPKGLLTAELREGRTVYRWPLPARDVMREELRRRWPERITPLHSRLARWYFAEGSVGLALGHAVDAEDWSLAIEIIEASWRPLIFQHGEVMWRAMTTMPPEMLKESPRALAARDTQLPISDELFRSIASLPDTEEELAELGRGEGAAEVLETCFGVLVALRHRGAVSQARLYGDRTLVVARAARSAHSEVSDLYPVLHLQVGITHLLGGDVEAALPPLRVAYDRAADNPLGYLEGDAAGKLALAHAVAGDLTQADVWSERHLLNSHPGHTWFDPHISTGGVVARLMVALDRLDLARADAAHAEVAELTHLEEFWAFIVHARAEYAVTVGTASEALAVLDRARADYEKWFRPGSFARPLIAAAEANLLLALGRANLAQRVLAGPDGEHPFLRVSHARLALMTGHTDRVLSLSQDAQWQRGASTRHRIEMSLMRAVAAARVGDTSLVVTAVETAVEMGRAHGVTRPFTTVPRGELAALADRVPALRELLQGDPLVGRGDIFPARVELIELTEREERVLEQLATDLTLPEIARAAVLSYNTLRTQQRSLYKKLGTSDRGKAVARARQLGLLPPP